MRSGVAQSDAGGRPVGGSFPPRSAEPRGLCLADVGVAAVVVGVPRGVCVDRADAGHGAGRDGPPAGPRRTAPGQGGPGSGRGVGRRCGRGPWRRSGRRGLLSRAGRWTAAAGGRWRLSSLRRCRRIGYATRPVPRVVPRSVTRLNRERFWRRRVRPVWRPGAPAAG